ncbi:MAG TPA: helical backbone metal receptor [Bacteroidia bacterium]|nr:helical backbone metal receptor [Bacteroidia bacterium]
MHKSTDQTGREIILKDYPSRIVSVVPSQTELLFDLGLGNEVAGVTKFCVHPAEARKTKAIVGGTKKLDIAKIRSINPDLILANKEENLRSEIETLAKEFPVWVSDVKTLDDVISMIHSVGELTNKVSEANVLCQKTTATFAQLSTFNFELRTKRSVYLIWHNPTMTIGSDTFIHHMLELCGLQNVFSGRTRYPEISSQELAEANPELILLSSEPFPFREKHMAHYQSICPSAKIIPVDGQMFSWYGSRLQHAPEYFLQLINSLNN